MNLPIFHYKIYCMTNWHVFSSFAYLFRYLKRQEKKEKRLSGVRGTLVTKETDSRPESSGSRFSSPASGNESKESKKSRPSSLQSTTHKGSSFRDCPADGKDEKKRYFPKTDKKGIRILTDKDNLYDLFGAKPREKTSDQRQEREEFSTLLKLYATDHNQKSLLNEKKKALADVAPLSVGEQIKSYPSPQAELDLHGYKSGEAETKTRIFIWNARYKGIRTVRIIVGKGLHSASKAILPDVVEAKLFELKREKWVLDFKWEKKDKNKSGALIVYVIPLLF
ncbi:MAG: Smr/MutS family protein [Candidatus Omnitrophota bacterium]